MRPLISAVFDRHRIAAEIVADDDIGPDAQFVKERRHAEAQRLHADQIDFFLRTASARRIRESPWASPAGSIRIRRYSAQSPPSAWETSGFRA
jgi:hypothetical protein